jgi:hypothetical protein
LRAVARALRATAAPGLGLRRDAGRFAAPAFLDFERRVFAGLFAADFLFAAIGYS